MLKIRSIAAAGFVITAGISASAFANPSSEEVMALQAELFKVAPQVPDYPIADALPLEWEHKKHPERKLWSEYTYSVVNAYLGDLDQAEDMVSFCPNYDQLTHDQQVQAWAQLFVGISRWESSWDPTERTLEGSEIDPETGEKVYSDGLLQLSYQDIESNPYCPFDWQTDKKLSNKDPHRTIFNPYSNLYCGIRTLADAITDNVDKEGHHKIAYNNYWSTLGPTGYVHSKLESITAEMHNTLPFCGPPMKGSPFKETFTKFANLPVNREVVKIYRTAVGDTQKIFKKKKKAQ